MFTRGRSFGDKLMVLVALTTGLAVVVVASSLSLGDLLRIKSTALATLSTHADVIAIHSTAALSFNDKSAGAETLSALRAVPQVVAATLHDRRGHVFATFARNDANNHAAQAPASNGHRFAGRELILTTAVEHGNRALGQLTLRYDLNSFYADLTDNVLKAIGIGLVAIVMALLLARQIRHGLALPIQALSRAADRVSRTGNYAVRAAVFDQDELGMLTKTFNHMLSKIEAFQARQIEAEKHRRRYTLELERSNRELDEFAYVASHDLRSPLQGIKSLANWIEEDNKALLPAKSQRHLEQMKQRVERLERLLNDLLQYSRAGRVSGALTDVDTRALCEDTAALLAPPEGFRVDIAADLPTLHTAKVPLELVFRNLINNAIKHHDRGSGVIEIGSEMRGEFVAFWVADDGPGIDPKYHEQIMKMFETLAPRDDVEGSGMGLAVIKKVVERAGGQLSVDSNGRGTRFTFTWPQIFPTGDE